MSLELKYIKAPFGAFFILIFIDKFDEISGIGLKNEIAYNIETIKNVDLYK